MIFCKKKKSPLTEEALLEISEARASQARARNNMEVMVRQRDRVADLVQTLIERREENHFGESIRISFTPRKTNA